MNQLSEFPVFWHGSLAESLREILEPRPEVTSGSKFCFGSFGEYIGRILKSDSHLQKFTISSDSLLNDVHVLVVSLIIISEFLRDNDTFGLCASGTHDRKR